MTPRREWLSFFCFAGPGIVLFGLFTWWPILYSGYVSLTDWRLTSPEVQFIGLDNYTDLLGDTAFWRVFLNTVLYAGCVVAGAQVLAFPLAALLSRPMPGRWLWRTLAFSPYVTMPVAAAFVWVLLLDPVLGPLRPVYGWFGVEGPRWPTDPVLALGAVILVGLWKETAFATVFYTAGRQNLSPDHYDAAKLDGAGGWQLLSRITLPLLRPVTFFLVVSGFVAAAKVFDTVILMTGGGPVYPDSSTFVVHLYTLGFREFRFGVASAFAMLFVVFLAGVSVVQFRLGRGWVQS